MNPPKLKCIVHENHKIHEQYLRKSPRQAGAWRSVWECHAPAWRLDGMFLLDITLCLLRLTVLREAH